MNTIWKELPAVNQDMYFEQLTDCQQTHALYGVTPKKIHYWQNYLKSFGAKNFQIIKNGYYPIICFEWLHDIIAEGKILSNKLINSEAYLRAKLLVQTTDYWKFYKSHYSTLLTDQAINYILNNYISIKILNIKNIKELLTESTLNDEDQFKIYSILDKSLKHKEEYLFADIDWDRAIQLTQQMNQFISSDEERIKRKNAAQRLGFFRIANIFKLI